MTTAGLTGVGRRRRTTTVAAPSGSPLDPWAPGGASRRTGPRSEPRPGRERRQRPEGSRSEPVSFGGSTNR
jgi:hypothetical protein